MEKRLLRWSQIKYRSWSEINLIGHQMCMEKPDLTVWVIMCPPHWLACLYILLQLTVWQLLTNRVFSVVSPQMWNDLCRMTWRLLSCYPASASNSLICLWSPFFYFFSTGLHLYPISNGPFGQLGCMLALLLVLRALTQRTQRLSSVWKSSSS